MSEQAEHLKSSLASVTRLQQSDSRADSHMFTSQADSLLHGYQALLAQVLAAHFAKPKRWRTLMSYKGSHVVLVQKVSSLTCMCHCTDPAHNQEQVAFFTEFF